MADPGSGILQGGLTYAFDPNADANSPLSYEQLQARRKIAEAMMGGRGLGYPKTIGEGIYAAADAFAKQKRLDDLEERDREFMAAQRKNAKDATDYPLPGDQTNRTADESPLATPPVATASAPDANYSLAPPTPSYWLQAGLTPYSTGDINTAFAPAAQQTADAGGAAAPTASTAQPTPDVLPNVGAAPYSVTATPEQKLAGRNALARVLAANPRGTMMGAPAPMSAPAQGGGAQPPFSLTGGSPDGAGGSIPMSAPASLPDLTSGGAGDRVSATAAPDDNPLTAMAQAAPNAGNPAIITDIPPAADVVHYRDKPKPPSVLAPGREERYAMARLRAAPTDPYNVATWKPIVDAYAADRAARYKLQTEDYTKGLEDYYAGGKEKRTLEAGEAKRQQELRKGQLEIPSTTAQNVLGQVDQSVLNTDRSPQRKGYPDVGVIPPGVITKDFLANRQKEMAADTQQVAKADQTVPDALKIIHDLHNHPGKDAATGFLGLAAQGLRGTDARDFAELVNRANGGAFLQAYQSIRGSGQISNVEGQKAEQAIANLSTAQSKEQFDKALNDYEASIRRGYEVAQRRVNQPVTAYRALDDNHSTAPDIGSVGIWNGIPQRYIGGDPSKDMSYVPVRR